MEKIHCASLLLICTLFILPISGVADRTLNTAAILNVNTPAGKAANTSLHFALQEINGTRLNLTILESKGFVGNGWNIALNYFNDFVFPLSAISFFT